MNVTNETPVSFAPINSNKAQQESPTTVTVTGSLDSEKHSPETIKQVPTAELPKSILKSTSSYNDDGKITINSPTSIKFSEDTKATDGKGKIKISISQTTSNQPNPTIHQSPSITNGTRSRSYSDDPSVYAPEFFSPPPAPGSVDAKIEEAFTNAGEFVSKSASQVFGGFKKTVRNVAQVASDASQAAHKYVGEPLGGIAKDLYEGEKPIEDIFIPGGEK
jgi:hypothetical protein